MAAGPSIDVTGWLEEQLAQASPDLLRSMVQTFAEALMGAEADAVCGAGYGERSDGAGEHPQRVPAAGLGHPGREHRAWRSRSCGRAPTSRTGCWSAAAAPRRPLVTVVATSYLLGVSTRRMEKLVETLGHHPAVASRRSARWPADLDELVEAFRTRPLDAGPYTFVARRADARRSARAAGR